ncbi:hypothetical protein BV898_06602 [Hypsibius exemplaris]|uniref:Uncharacterized protein n=1 Tax=Hypsibius exemplaris TaxID=2072580 RepID=A0A1W0WVY4_HYPEX|nr:hypothetical protein BV898_06602 [Hypsibius exemplaris]
MQTENGHGVRSGSFGMPASPGGSFRESAPPKKSSQFPSRFSSSSGVSSTLYLLFPSQAAAESCRPANHRPFILATQASACSNSAKATVAIPSG